MNIYLKRHTPLPLLALIAWWITAPQSVFAFALAVRGNVLVQGNNITFDSFDSSDPNYNTNGIYDSSKAKDNGDVIVTGVITNSIPVGSVLANGHVSAFGQIPIGSSGGIGSRSWLATHTGIEPGWSTTGGDFVTPAISFPYTSGLSPTAGSVVMTFGGHMVTNHFDHVLSTGDYWQNGAYGGTTLVLGNARLAVTSTLNLSGSGSLWIVSNASVQIFAGGSCQLGTGNTVINEQGLASAFAIYCLPSSAAVTINGNGKFTGVIIAPSATFSLNGGGNNITHLIGLFLFNSVIFNGNTSFHFDESLNHFIQPPAIVVPPQNQTLLTGQNAAFDVLSSGFPFPNYQWQLNGSTALADATNASVTLSNVVSAQAGSYSVVVSNAFGALTSAPAVLSVYDSAAATLSSAHSIAGRLRFDAAGVPGFQYVIQASTNLSDWLPIATNLSPFTITDTNSAGFPSRFYRAVYIP
jgi:hypothetical protein